MSSEAKQHSEKQGEDQYGGVPVPDFPIGDLVQIECEGKKYSSILRGVVVPSCFLLDVPMVKGKAVPFYYNTRIAVRFISHGAVYGFMTLIIKVNPRPPLLLLGYPKKIEKFKLRKGDRVDVFIPVRVTCDKLPKISQGAILNLSEKGALLVMKKEEGMVAGQQILLEMTLPNQKPLKSMLGTIRHLQQSESKMNVGLCFVEDAEGYLQKARSFFQDCYSYQKDSL